MTLSRRNLLAGAAVAGGVSARAADGAAARRQSSHHGFDASWASFIAGYQAPEWFRDAKLGIFAHWGPQCVPEYGDWYARRMYLQGDSTYDHHVKTYGHPSEFGFVDVISRWKAERWDPDRLLDLYTRAGAKYLVAMAVHHDNFDNYDSAHHSWNATRIGPRRDIIGTWAKHARARGFRFGVSNHASHAWHWLQPAYGYDPEGPRAGVRYDAARRTAADGAGRAWRGLDPQELYTGPNMPMPAGIRSMAEADIWHEQNDRQWDEAPPPHNPAFVRQWSLRCRDLIDKYRPDLLYFDDWGLPLGQAGIDAAAHLYNQSLQWNDGRMESVVTAKRLMPQQRFGVVEDVERGGRATIDSAPWQTDTCIGDWQYSRPLYDAHGYKSARAVVNQLCDVVSKNGNLLLSIPLRPDGTHDDQEEALLGELAGWMAVNGEAIHATRPWRVFGEGPSNNGGGDFGEAGYGAPDAHDMRFTTRGEALYAILLGRPKDGAVAITSLGVASKIGRGRVERVGLLGGPDALPFARSAEALTLTLPAGAAASLAPVLKIEGLGLTG